MNLNNKQKQFRRKLITAAYNMQFGHIPTALAFIDAQYFIAKYLNKRTDALVIGNANTPLLFNNFYALCENDFDNALIYPAIGKNCCKYTSLSFGNTIGIASGIALSKQFNNVVITSGDSILHAGTEIEALMYIGNTYKQMSNVCLIVNADNIGCISSFDNFDNTIENMLKSFNWNIARINGHDFNELTMIKDILQTKIHDKPICILLQTVKGAGVKFMEEDPIAWNYKRLDQDYYNKALTQLS